MVDGFNKECVMLYVVRLMFHVRNL